VVSSLTIKRELAASEGDTGARISETKRNWSNSRISCWLEVVVLKMRRDVKFTG
jgi:hypothetical protein